MTDRITRRASTDGRPVTSNRINGIRRIVGGWGVSMYALHYRRKFQDGTVYTGPVPR